MTGTVKATTGLDITIRNDVGGTEGIGPGVFRVELVARGRRYSTGRLVNRADIEAARKKGTTGFTPETYRNSPNKNLYADTVRAAFVSNADRRREDHANHPEPLRLLRRLESSLRGSRL